MQHRITLLALATMAIAPPAFAQSGQIDVSGATPTIVVSDVGTTAGTGINNPLYLPARSEYSGIANLWMRGNSPGNAIQGACTGNLLWTGRHILTAAHCIANSAGVLRDPFGTARFRNAGGGWTNYNWSSVAIRGGYSGAVVEEQDVAILTLDNVADNAFERYLIANEDPTGKRVRFQGYGRTGTGLTGDNNTANSQFDDNAVLRRGWNRFDTTCTEAAGPSPIFATCANNANANKGAFGGILMSDFDNPTNPNAADLCTQLSICVGGEPGLEEVSIGRGDSGSAAFIESNNRMVGVASWGVGSGGNLAQFNRIGGMACVANYAPNAACLANYNFIVNTIGAPPTVVIPEPSTYALLATGLFAMGVVARRRRSAK